MTDHKIGIKIYINWQYNLVKMKDEFKDQQTIILALPYLLMARNAERATSIECLVDWLYPHCQDGGQN